MEFSSQICALSLVVPCFNEEMRVQTFIREWQKFSRERKSELALLFPRIEIVFVNDGSTDKTFDLLQSAATELVRSEVDLSVTCHIENLPMNMGKGAAVRKGILNTQGAWILMTDVDLSTPLHELFLLERTKADLAMGSRALPESRILKPQNGLRPMLGRGFNLFIRILTGIPYLDTQCGFKLIRGDLARSVASKMRENRFAFDIEMLLIANQAQAQIEEVPVKWAHQEPSRVSPLMDGIKMALKVVLFSVRYKRWRSSKNEKKIARRDLAEDETPQKIQAYH